MSSSTQKRNRVLCCGEAESPTNKMKERIRTLIFIAVTLLFCVEAHSQGRIDYNNDSSSLIQLTPGSPVPVNSGYEVELFYQPNTGGLAPISVLFAGGNWQGTSVVPISTIPGGFSATPDIISLTGITGGANAWIDIVAWNNAATTLANALQFSTLLSSAPVFSITAANPNGIGNNPPPSPPSLVGPGMFQGITFTPEPSTTALGAIAAFTLLFHQLRKRS
ncbi:MAG TPA: hypothetical protein VH413_04030 [Verrucomicrobiae bacterium]|jgi:hypothetical protein|nr:hypothetical protein [Verrucomicrobiae bacterium]